MAFYAGCLAVLNAEFTSLADLYTMFRTLGAKIAAYLKEGLTPQKWAASLAVGVVAGLFPIPGPVTLLCIGLSFWWRLHLPLVLVVVYALYPLQLMLVPPFALTGSWLVGSARAEGIEVVPVGTNWKQWGFYLWEWGLLAMLGWLVLSLPLGLVIYKLGYLRGKRNLQN